MDEVYQKRISYGRDLEILSRIICEDFFLGEFVTNKIITSGYEDFNLYLQTRKGKYLVKIFADFRNDEDCKRYVNVILKAIESNVRVPKLYKSNQGYLHIKEIDGSKLRMCVMDFVNGENIFSSGYKLNDEDIKFISNQASIINSINIKPEYVYDSWAIVNFSSEFEKTKEYLESEDLELIEPLVEKFNKTDIKDLPHCFVHGDLIDTNVIRDKSGVIWITDFAVSNYYPRIQELAVLACNLFFDKEDKRKTENNIKIALEEYQKKIKLEPEELEILPNYINFAHAMHVIGATREEKVNNIKLKENAYWLEQGRSGLRQNKDDLPK